MSLSDLEWLGLNLDWFRRWSKWFGTWRITSWQGTSSWEISDLSRRCQINILSGACLADVLMTPGPPLLKAASQSFFVRSWRCWELQRIHMSSAVTSAHVPDDKKMWTYKSGHGSHLWATSLHSPSTAGAAPNISNRTCKFLWWNAMHPTPRVHQLRWFSLTLRICGALYKSEGPPKPSLTYQFNISITCAYAHMKILCIEYLCIDSLFWQMVVFAMVPKTPPEIPHSEGPLWPSEFDQSMTLRLSFGCTCVEESICKFKAFSVDQWWTFKVCISSIRWSRILKAISSLIYNATSSPRVPEENQGPTTAIFWTVRSVACRVHPLF